MRVTIQQIAEQAGVSRGTVDRVINERGRVNQEVRERVLAVANELGYVPYRVKREQAREQAEAARRRRKIGVVTQLSGKSFMTRINQGISAARKELQPFGFDILLRANERVDEEDQLRSLDELEKEEIDGLAIMPVESDNVRNRINELTDRGIPVVTFNADIDGTGRISYVGMDNFLAGRTAAGLLGVMMHRTRRVMVITGSFGNNVNTARVDGFVQEVRENYPDIDIEGIHVCHDRAEEVARAVVQTLSAARADQNEIEGILIVSGGQNGLRMAFSQMKGMKRPYVIAYDETPRNSRLLRERMVDFVIDQNGYMQGYRSLMILCQYLSNGEKPESEHEYTGINILTRYNVSVY